MIHGTPRSADPKVESAAVAIRRLNPHVTVETHATRLVAANALDLIGALRHHRRRVRQFRHALSRVRRLLLCQEAARSRLPSGIFDGTLTTLRAHERSADGAPNPTYRCLFPEPPPPGSVPACAEAGILGALTGVLGSLMALEVIRRSSVLARAWSAGSSCSTPAPCASRRCSTRWDPSNPLSGEHPTIHDLSAHA